MADLTDGDITAINRMADEYESLMARWREARAGSQETANLHAAFKAMERALGRLAEDGLLWRIRAALTAASAPAASAPAQPETAVHRALPSSQPASDVEDEGPLLAAAVAAAEALQELLNDTQHKDHDCGDEKYCPVLHARTALAALRAAIGKENEHG